MLFGPGCDLKTTIKTALATDEAGCIQNQTKSEVHRYLPGTLARTALVRSGSQRQGLDRDRSTPSGSTGISGEQICLDTIKRHLLMDQTSLHPAAILPRCGHLVGSQRLRHGMGNPAVM
jgi:hypothetical protein